MKGALSIVVGYLICDIMPLRFQGVAGDRMENRLQDKGFVIPSLWVSELREANDRFDAYAEQLRERITSYDAEMPAYFNSGEEPILGQSARGLLADWVCGKYHLEKGGRYGFLESSKQTLEMVAQFNEAKADFAAIYAQIRSDGGDDVSQALASQRAHDAIQMVTSGIPDFTRIRALNCCVPRSLERIRWYMSDEKKNQRKTLKDAIAVLKENLSRLEPNAAALCQLDLEELQKMEPSTPVAFTKKTTVKNIRCRHWSLDRVTNERITGTVSGALPLFVLTAHLDSIDVSLPSTKRKAGAGRPSLISSKQVSLWLHGWYWYKDETAPKKRPVSPVCEKRSPLPKLDSPVKELFINARVIKGKWTPQVNAYVPDSHRSTTTIGRMRLMEAWAVAVERLLEIDERFDPEELMAAAPDQSSFDEWLKTVKSLPIS